MSSRMKVFFDGGCRPNPGAMEIAAVAAGQTTMLRDLGQGTSTDAKWLALIHALTIARSLDTANFILIGDAADIVEKTNGTVTCRGAGIRHPESVRALASAASPLRVRYIKRSRKLARIALAGVYAR